MKVGNLKPRIFYGGVRSGDVGGGLVKIARLSSKYPNHWLGFNVFYSISNSVVLNSSSISLLKRRNVRIVHNQNGIFYPDWYAGDWRKKNLEMSCALVEADWVFYQSKFCQLCADQFLGQPTGKSEILYNAVDLGLFRPRVTPKPKDSTDAFCVLVTGKFTRQIFYRLELSLRALHYGASLGLNLQMLVAGYMDRFCIEKFSELVALLGLGTRVIWRGAYRQDQATGIYNSADLYLMLKQNDPCPNTVIEALACGLPVVYADSGGVGELVDSCCGIGLDCKQQGLLAVNSPEIDQIVEGLKQAMDRHTDMAVAARERAVEKFSLANWLSRHQVVLDLLLE